MLAAHLQCFSSNLLLLFWLHAAKSAHVVQPVSQLDHNNAYFFGHGQEQLAKVLCLDICPRRHARDLADLTEPSLALYNASDCRAKPIANLLKRDIVGVLYGIMQQTCTDRPQVNCCQALRLTAVDLQESCGRRALGKPRCLSHCDCTRPALHLD